MSVLFSFFIGSNVLFFFWLHRNKQLKKQQKFFFGRVSKEFVIVYFLKRKNLENAKKFCIGFFVFFFLVCFVTVMNWFDFSRVLCMCGM